PFFLCCCAFAFATPFVLAACIVIALFKRNIEKYLLKWCLGAPFGVFIIAGLVGLLLVGIVDYYYVSVLAGTVSITSMPFIAIFDYCSLASKKIREADGSAD